MKKITDQIVLRPLAPNEENFWREVFYDSVSWHFAALNLPEGDLQNLLEMQFQAQSIDYGKNYPQADKEVILYDDVLAGRVISSTEHGDFHVIDIAVLSEYRNRGIGTQIFEWFFAQSRQTKLPIRFYVEKINPARRFYERLGFQTIADVTTHYQMEWRG